jgi:ligand-binding SRPBCC domain-containing protein
VRPPSSRLITDSRALAALAKPPRPQPGLRRHFSTVHLHRPLPEIFAFFSEVRNLEVLTPPELQLRVLGPEDVVAGAGAEVDLRMTVHGLPIRWRSRLVRWDPPSGFVDEQVSGPYSIWHHTHSFTDEGDRVRMDDEVLYRLPLWPLGELAAPWVSRELDRVFSYRRARILEIFG